MSAATHETPAPAPPAAPSTGPSTGPKTPEGKASSSRNAVTHGLHAQETVLPHLGESRAEYEALQDGLARELRPRTAVEQHYVEQIAQAMWRLRRLSRWESGLYDDPALTDEDRINRLARVLRHDAALRRHIDRALRALRDGVTNCQNEPAPAALLNPPAVGGPCERGTSEQGGRQNCQNEPLSSLPQRHSPPVSGPSPVPSGEGCRRRGGGLLPNATNCQNEPAPADASFLPPQGGGARGTRAEGVSSPPPPRAGALRRAKKLQQL